MSNHEVVQEKVITFYEKFCLEIEDWRPHLEIKYCPMIGAKENNLDNGTNGGT